MREDIWRRGRRIGPVHLSEAFQEPLQSSLGNCALNWPQHLAPLNQYLQLAEQIQKLIALGGRPIHGGLSYVALVHATISKR